MALALRQLNPIMKRGHKFFFCFFSWQEWCRTFRAFEISIVNIKIRWLKTEIKKVCVFTTRGYIFRFWINKDGVLPLPEEVEIIKNAQVPKNVTGVKSFLGFINYYHRHLQNFLSFLEPLHCLSWKETPWKWTDKENNSFNKGKKLLSSANLLVHYDTKKPLILACDTSPYGLGAVLSYIMEDGSERPIAFTSGTLSKAEQNYQGRIQAIFEIGNCFWVHENRHPNFW